MKFQDHPNYRHWADRHPELARVLEELGDESGFKKSCVEDICTNRGLLRGRQAALQRILERGDAPEPSKHLQSFWGRITSAKEGQDRLGNEGLIVIMTTMEGWRCEVRFSRDDLKEIVNNRTQDRFMITGKVAWSRGSMFILRPNPTRIGEITNDMMR